MMPQLYDRVIAMTAKGRIEGQIRLAPCCPNLQDDPEYGVWIASKDGDPAKGRLVLGVPASDICVRG